jgi:hypothetical protein
MPNASGLAAAIRGSTGESSTVVSSSEFASPFLSFPVSHNPIIQTIQPHTTQYNTIESDTFDLAGQNVNTITNTIQSAFQDPFPIHDMIRITFVTGAGKLGRQKYDANAAQAVTSTLRELGFEDDRGASCVKECAGFFKLQHDTGKNLKTVVVFPRIVVAEEAVADTTGDGGPFASSTASMFQKGSPQEMMALSSKSVFESMVKSRCPSWSQKKGCIVVLTEIKTTVGEMEQKLLTGTPLTDPEQTFYDSVSSNALDEKVEHVKTLMHQQVDDGLLTSKEKTQLVSQVQERLETLSKDLAEAEKENKAKKVEKLKDIMKKAEARKEKLSKITPKGPHRLKHEAEILKLRAEMQPLLDLEEGSKGRLLSVKETQTLARKDEILDEIAELEVCGWSF